MAPVSGRCEHGLEALATLLQQAGRVATYRCTRIRSRPFADGPSSERTALKNILSCGFPSDRLYVVKRHADTIRGTRYQLEIPTLSETTETAVRKTLGAAKLDKLMNVRNPLDLTPMAGESVYAGCAAAMLDDECIDALIVSRVPLTAQRGTAPIGRA